MKVGIIGYGSMGSAMAKIIQEHHEVFVYTRRPETVKEKGMTAVSSLDELGKASDAVILAVKPKDLEEIADDLDPVLKKGTPLLSILVGTSLEKLRAVFSNPHPYRLMPNLPLLCGKGLIGVATEENQDQKGIEEILKGLGKVVWLEERLMNPFAALTGSSPAFICLMIEAMVQAGITVGFPELLSQEYVLETFEGTVALIKQTGLSPVEVRNAVASPGGTTIAGLNEMEHQNVRHSVMRGVFATLEKGQSMES